MEQETPAWKRLKLVIKESGMTVNAFAYHIGLNCSENLYQIKRGNHGISRELTNLINMAYPQFGIGWLLTGEGKCGSNDPNEIQVRNEIFKLISVYEKLPRDLDTLSILTTKKIYLPKSIIRDSEFGLINVDEAITPKVPLGAIMLVREHSGVIVYGKIYIIQTEYYSIIRTLRKTNKSGYVRLTSSQPRHYDDIIIKQNEIKKLYSVDFILAELN